MKARVATDDELGPGQRQVSSAAATSWRGLGRRRSVGLVEAACSAARVWVAIVTPFWPSSTPIWPSRDRIWGDGSGSGGPVGRPSPAGGWGSVTGGVAAAGPGGGRGGGPEVHRGGRRPGSVVVVVDVDDRGRGGRIGRAPCRPAPERPRRHWAAATTRSQHRDGQCRRGASDDPWSSSSVGIVEVRALEDRRRGRARPAPSTRSGPSTGAGARPGLSPGAACS